MTTAKEDDEPDAVPSIDRLFGIAVSTTAIKRNISKKRLAAALHVSPSGLSKKLWGHRPWVLKEQIAIADALGVDLRDLLAEMWDDGPVAAHPLRRSTDVELPRLDSNQQPFDYRADGDVIDLDTYRARRAS